MNNEVLYKSELIYSKIIRYKFTNIELSTCFNIYKKTPECTDYRKQKKLLEDVDIIKLARSNKKEKHLKIDFDYDYCFCAYGTIFKPSKPYQSHKQCV